jgi:hypothetical protein
MTLARFLTALACTACTGAMAQPAWESPSRLVVRNFPMGVVLAGGQMQVDTTPPQWRRLQARRPTLWMYSCA